MHNIKLDLNLLLKKSKIISYLKSISNSKNCQKKNGKEIKIF